MAITYSGTRFDAWRSMAAILYILLKLKLITDDYHNDLIDDITLRALDGDDR
jgi:hypothetical protein